MTQVQHQLLKLALVSASIAAYSNLTLAATDGSNQIVKAFSAQGGPPGNFRDAVAGVLQGSVAPGFEEVRKEFDANFMDDIEVGAAFSVIRDDQYLVDLWGGYSDRDCTTPWQADTLVNVYSTTKGFASAVVAWVVEQGLLDYEAEVRRYWPQLKAARNGLTVAQLLSHQAGLCGLRRSLQIEDLYDHKKMVRELAAADPLWEPGTAAGYHAVTWGFLAAELVRRVTGHTLGSLLQHQFSEPLSADVHIGLPLAEHHRVAQMIGARFARRQPDVCTSATMQLPPLYPLALNNPVIRPYKDVCSEAWRSAEIPAANGHASARGIARFYGALGTIARDGTDRGQGVLSAEILAQATQQEWGMEPDLVLGYPMRRGRGFNLNTDVQYGPEKNSFGHSGAGGSVGFADPVRGLGFGYVMNQMQSGLDEDTRAGRLIRAVYRCC